jgi:glutathione peroxidase
MQQVPARARAMTLAPRRACRRDTMPASTTSCQDTMNQAANRLYPGLRPGLLACAAVAAASFVALPVQAQPQSQKTAAAPAAATCPALLQHSLPRLQDEKPQALCQYAGKVLLVVNTASYCGFTPQYEGLEALHAKYAARGLVVMGFPVQRLQPGRRRQQEDRRPVFQHLRREVPDVQHLLRQGRRPNPLFAALTRATGKAPSWNFNKYLVDRKGQAVAHFGSMVRPGSNELTAAIEKALATP